MATMKPKRESLPRLAFSGDPEFHGGVNLSIRVGDKWIKHYLAGRTKCVVLNGDGKRIGKADIHAVYYLPLDRVTDDMLKHDHESPGVNWRTKFLRLHAVYGVAVDPSRRVNVHPSTFVSCVWFTVTLD